MIPLLVIAIALAGGLAAYQFSPSAHAWVDDHVAALRAAIAAHREADAHLQTAAIATSAGDVAKAQQHVAEAVAANQVAARKTTDAVVAAKTPSQRQAAAQSAATIDDRSRQIAAAMAHLGLGQCGVRSYAGVTGQVKDALLARLHAAGMVVTGEDPYDIDTQTLGVKLRAAWDPRAQQLKLIVTAAPQSPGVCDLIWHRIEPIMKEVVGT
jgi:hypothetical protein